MQHVWQHHISPQGVLWVRLAGFEHKHAQVRCKASPDGKFMWQFGLLVGYEPTIPDAIAWVEALAENQSIPASLRWIEPENYLKREYGK